MKPHDPPAPAAAAPAPLLYLLPLLLLLLGALIIPRLSGNGLVPVAGRLLRGGAIPESGLQVNFEPVEKGSVPMAMGGVQLDGTFRMYTLPEAGVRPGRYIVCVSVTPLSGANCPPELSHPATSPWRLDVPAAGFRDLVLDLQQAEVPAKRQ